MFVGALLVRLAVTSSPTSSASQILEHNKNKINCFDLACLQLQMIIICDIVAPWLSRSMGDDRLRRDPGRDVADDACRTRAGGAPRLVVAAALDRRLGRGEPEPVVARIERVRPHL